MTVLSILTACEDALQTAIDEKEKEDQEAADEVSTILSALPDPDAVTVDDKVQIEEARAAYKGLTDDQQKLIDPDLLDRLVADEEALALAEAKKAEDDKTAADEVTKEITNLPAADSITVADKELIESARTAFNALTPDQQALVDPAALQKLTEAEAALIQAEEKKAEEDKKEAEKKEADQKAANAVSEQISLLPDPAAVTEADKAKIEDAIKAYNALTDDQKKLVPNADLEKLQSVEQALKAIPSIGDVVTIITPTGTNITGTLISNTDIKVTSASANGTAVAIPAKVNVGVKAYDVVKLSTGTVKKKYDVVTIEMNNRAEVEPKIVVNKNAKKTKKIVVKAVNGQKLKASQFNKQAFKGLKGKIVIKKSAMSKKEFKKLVKKLRKGGFKGKVMRVK